MYDIYLSYSHNDKSVIDTISCIFRKENKKLRIFDKHQQVDPNASWQEGIHQVSSNIA